MAQPLSSANPYDEVQHLDGVDLIAAARTLFPGRLGVISSFGAESAVLLDLVAQVDKALPVIFLDTRELFDETYVYRDQLVAALGLTALRVVTPEPVDLAEAEDLWRTDHDRCCYLRKVKPLETVAAGFDALIDGRKRAHGFDRASLRAIEVGGSLVKISPLWSWDESRIADAFRTRGLPSHPLVSQGYRSIGCWPCTRPTEPGESPRSGRWSGSAKTECGIHVSPLDSKD